MTEDNLEYYERRAREEAKAVAASDNISAASVHRLLATEYEAQARDLRKGQNRQMVRPKLTLRTR
jgi:hypothetical protein